MCELVLTGFFIAVDIMFKFFLTVNTHITSKHYRQHKSLLMLFVLLLITLKDVILSIKKCHSF